MSTQQSRKQLNIRAAVAVAGGLIACANVANLLLARAAGSS